MPKVRHLVVPIASNREESGVTPVLIHQPLYECIAVLEVAKLRAMNKFWLRQYVNFVRTAHAQYVMAIDSCMIG